MVWAAAPGWGQLTEDPATWLKADGVVTAEARVTDLMAAMQAANLGLRAAAEAGTPRKEASGLAATLPKLLQARNVNYAWRVAARLLAVAEGKTPGEWLEVASAYDLVLDRAVVTPGTRLHAKLTPWFALTSGLKGEYEVRLAVVDEAGGEVAKAGGKVPGQMGVQEYSLATEKLGEGRYLLRYELREGEEVRARGERVFFVNAGWRTRWAGLRGELREAQLKGVRGARGQAALGAVEWAVAMMEWWMEGGPAGQPGGMHPFVETYAAGRLPRMASANPDEEGWRQAEGMVKALKEGRDGLAGMMGEVRLARRNAAGVLTPYRVWLPGGEAAKRPVVVLLHSFYGDEGSWGGVLSGGKLAELAAKHGVVVASPLNVAAFADPTKEGVAELERLAAEVVEAFGGDGERVYLAGHGTGAAEAMVYGLGVSGRFAGVGAVAGAPPAMFDMKAGLEKPVMYVYSAADEVAPEREMRKWAAYVETRLKRGKAVRLEKVKHVDAAAEALPRLLEFFVTPPPASGAVRE